MNIVDLDELKHHIRRLEDRFRSFVSRIHYVPFDEKPFKAFHSQNLSSVIRSSATLEGLAQELEDEWDLKRIHNAQAALNGLCASAAVRVHMGDESEATQGLRDFAHSLWTTIESFKQDRWYGDEQNNRGRGSAIKEGDEVGIYDRGRFQTLGTIESLQKHHWTPTVALIRTSDGELTGAVARILSFPPKVKTR